MKTKDEIDALLEKELDGLARDTGDPLFSEVRQTLLEQRAREAVDRQLETGKKRALLRMKSPSDEVH